MKTAFFAYLHLRRGHPADEPVVSTSQSELLLFTFIGPLARLVKDVRCGKLCRQSEFAGFRRRLCDKIDLISFGAVSVRDVLSQ